MGAARCWSGHSTRIHRMYRVVNRHVRTRNLSRLRITDRLHHWARSSTRYSTGNLGSHRPIYIPVPRNIRRLKGTSDRIPLIRVTVHEIGWPSIVCRARLVPMFVGSGVSMHGITIITVGSRDSDRFKYWHYRTISKVHRVGSGRDGGPWRIGCPDLSINGFPNVCCGGVPTLIGEGARCD